LFNQQTPARNSGFSLSKSVGGGMDGYLCVSAGSTTIWGILNGRRFKTFLKMKKQTAFLSSEIVRPGFS
jgi:hypothetical protein